MLKQQQQPLVGAVEVIDIASTSSEEGGNNEDQKENEQGGGGGGGLVVACKSKPPFVSIPPKPDSSCSSVTYPDFVELVANLLASDTEIDMPEAPTPENFNKEILEFTTRKLAYWILKNEQDPPPKVKVHSELHDEETMEISPMLLEDYEQLDILKMASDDEVDDNVRDGNGKSKKQKQQMSEFLGANYVKAKLRIPGDPLENDVFTAFFVADEGTNYYDKNFEGTCIPCDARVLGRLGLEEHLRSDEHKTCFRNLSLNIGQSQYQESCEERQQQSSMYKAKLKPPSDYESLLLSDGSKRTRITPVEKRALLSRLHIEDYEIPDDHAQNDAKVKLRYAGRWTNVLEKKWKCMKEEEAKILMEYKELKNRYIEDPSSHPDHDKCDISSECPEYWIRRLLDILKSTTEVKLKTVKASMGMDAKSLKKIFESNNSPPGKVQGVLVSGPPYFNPRQHYRQSNVNSFPSHSHCHTAPMNYTPSRTYATAPARLQPYLYQPQLPLLNNPPQFMDTAPITFYAVRNPSYNAVSQTMPTFLPPGPGNVYPQNFRGYYY